MADYSEIGSENAELLQAIIDGETYDGEATSRNAAILKSIIDKEEYTDDPQSEIEALLIQLKAVIEAGGDFSKVDISLSDYNNLTPAEKADATKIYFITGTDYLYYLNIKYKGEFPIVLESNNTVETTSVQQITLEKGYHYLFTTIYSGGQFTNAIIEAGSQRVFNQDGYDRVIYVISTQDAEVTYTARGGIDSNKYIKFRIKKNDVYDDSLMFTNTPQSAWNVSQSPTISVEKDSYYMITYKASEAPNITGATPVCYTYIGETDAKKSISMIIKATADSITISDYNENYSYFYYQKLTY